MKSKYAHLRERVRSLRLKGYTYGEINSFLKADIPKSTMVYWCNDIIFSEVQKERVAELVLNNVNKARLKALSVSRAERGAYWNRLFETNYYLGNIAVGKDVSKLILAALFIGEGSKTVRGSLVFGNANPHVIKLYLKLLRVSYLVVESKFRCTVQCRADQNSSVLMSYWSQVTRIPMSQFYPSRVDTRTLGKPSQKTEYKGVCRIDYFSAAVYNELRVISSILFGLKKLGL